MDKQELNFRRNLLNLNNRMNYVRAGRDVNPMPLMPEQPVEPDMVNITNLGTTRNNDGRIDMDIDGGRRSRRNKKNRKRSRRNRKYKR